MDDYVVMDDNLNSISLWMIIYEKLALVGYLLKFLFKYIVVFNFYLMFI